MNRLQLQLYSGTSEPGEGGEGGVLPVMAYINERVGISLVDVYEKA